MFSADDIVDVYSLVPPDHRPPTENGGHLPLLIRTDSGQNFVTAHGLHKDFERVVTTSAIRIPVPTVSRSLNVSIDVVSKLVRGNPTLALLSQDGEGIISKAERDGIEDKLVNALTKELVYKTEFVRSHDLDQKSLESIVETAMIKDSLAENTEEYLLSKAYVLTLSKEISQKLKEGLEINQMIELRPQSLPGTPPMWLVQRRLDQLSDFAPDSDLVLSQLHIQKAPDVISCTPKRSILTQRDETIAELQSGKVFAFELESFRQTFRELYESPQALANHLLEFSSVTVMGAFAVSAEKLSTLVGDAQRKLDEEGSVDLKAILTPDVPCEIEDSVRDDIRQKILTTTPGDGKPVRHVGNYLMQEHNFSGHLQTLLNFANSQAHRQWESLKDASDKDPKFQMAEIVASIPDHENALRAVAGLKESEVAAAEQFSTVISDVELENEKDFSIFWTEKVTPRVCNYNAALGSIDEKKLSEQLTELLANYLRGDLLVDAVSKARSQGLLRSKRTRKNVNRFEATLKANQSDPASILATLEKFGRKQGLPEVDMDAAEMHKKSMVQDMVRRMQRTKTDAPSMFLSLVVILFAKHHQGVVYATGKFAPKLLKQLKTKIGSDAYEQVEKWKEQAKAGNLPKEDRMAMVQMAEEATTS